MNKSLPSLIAGTLLIVVLFLYMVTFQVRFTQVAVVKTFGRSTPPSATGSGDVITEPGLYWKWPWPIQEVSIYDNRVQISTNPGEETPTRDGKPIIVTTTVAWRIKDPYRFSQTCGSMTEGADRLKTLVRNDQKTAISQYAFSNFVSTSPGELKYDDIEKRILSEVQTKAADLYGIEVDNIGMERLALPQRITETVFEAMKKERQALVAQYTSEGESQATTIKARAEGIADSIQSFADSKAKEIINTGLAQANKYYAEFKKDEGLATFLLKIDTLPKLLKERSTTVVLDQNTPLLDLLFPPSGAAASQPADASRSAAAGAVGVLNELKSQ